MSWAGKVQVQVDLRGTGRGRYQNTLCNSQGTSLKKSSHRKGVGEKKDKKEKGKGEKKKKRLFC